MDVPWNQPSSYWGTLQYHGNLQINQLFGAPHDDGTMAPLWLPASTFSAGSWHFSSAGASAVTFAIFIKWIWYTVSLYIYIYMMCIYVYMCVYCCILYIHIHRHIHIYIYTYTYTYTYTYIYICHMKWPNDIFLLCIFSSSHLQLQIFYEPRIRSGEPVGSVGPVNSAPGDLMDLTLLLVTSG